MRRKNSFRLSRSDYLEPILMLESAENGRGFERYVPQEFYSDECSCANGREAAGFPTQAHAVTSHRN